MNKKTRKEITIFITVLELLIIIDMCYLLSELYSPGRGCGMAVFSLVVWVFWISVLAGSILLANKQKGAGLAVFLNAVLFIAGIILVASANNV